MKHFLGGLIVFLSLCGCSSEKGSASTDEQRNSIAGAVHRPLDQARDAEKQVFDSAEQQKRQAESL